MRVRTYINNGYTFKEYSGNFQKIKYDAKKDDYFLTYEGRKFYFNDCLRTGTPWTAGQPEDDKFLVGTWQEGYCVYKLICKDEAIHFSDSSLCKIVYCPPAVY